MSIRYSAALRESMITLSGSMDQNIDMGMKSATVTMIIVNNFSTGSKLEIHLICNMYSLSTGLVSVYDKDPVNDDQIEIIGARV